MKYLIVVPAVGLLTVAWTQFEADKDLSAWSLIVASVSMVFFAWRDERKRNQRNQRNDPEAGSLPN